MKNNRLKEPNPVTDEDRIVSYLMGEVEELPERLLEKKKVYDYVLTNLLEHRQDKQIVELLRMQFNIQKSAAYKTIQQTKEIHGRAFVLSRNFGLYQQQQDIERAKRWALEEKNMTAYLKAIEMGDKLLQRIPEEMNIPWDKLGQKNYFMLFQLQAGQLLQLDSKYLNEIKQEEKEQILEAITPAAIDATYEILEDEIRKSAGN